MVQSVRDYEADAEERAFMKAVVQGLVDVEQGRTVSLEDAKTASQAGKQDVRGRVNILQI